MTNETVIETTTTVPTTTTQYLNDRIAAAVETQQAREAEEKRKKQVERDEWRDKAIANLRERVEEALDAPLRQALNLRYEATARSDYDWRAEACFTLHPEDVDLAITQGAGGVLRLYATGDYSDLGYIYPQDGDQNLLVGIATYRCFAQEREQRLAATAAAAAERVAARLAEQQAEQAERAAEEAARAATPAPAGRVIADELPYRRVVELAFTPNVARIVTLHRNGPVELLELTPHWEVDDQGRSTADHFTLSQSEMAMLVAAYTAFQAEVQADAAARQNDDDLIDGIEAPF